MIHGKKNILIILASIVIILFGSLFIHFQKRLGVFSHYRNSIYGFDLDYPKNLVKMNKKAQKLSCDTLLIEVSCDKLTSTESNLLIAIVNSKLDGQTAWDAGSVQDVHYGKGIGRLTIIGGRKGYDYKFAGADYKTRGIQIPLDDNHFLMIEENSKNPLMRDSDWKTLFSTITFTDKIFNPIAHTESKLNTDTFTWLIEEAGVDRDFGPKTKVTLRNTITSEDYFSKEYIGSCSKFDNGDHSLEKTEISEVDCWWEGGGSNIGVFYENGKYLLKQGISSGGNFETVGVDEWVTITEIII